ncbi:lysyl oxidase family protein [Nocardioides sp. C4-1]|uniref:lysyl oxidase family protein n=1 Tax=Nocardioides sp. C4-1 TaxID=3151851 RepID=UPI003264B9E9
MPRRTRRAVVVATITTLAPLTAVSGLASLTPAHAEPGAVVRAAVDPVKPALWGPRSVTTEVVGRTKPGTKRKGLVPLPVRLTAGSESIEIRTTRTSYAEPVRAVLTVGDRTVPLPGTVVSGFRGVDRLLTIRAVHRKTGRLVATRTRSGCLNQWGTQRARPDAEPRSPYPMDCAGSTSGGSPMPYTLGSVQGVQAGWSTPLVGYDGGIWLPRGSYTIQVSLRPVVAQALGLTPAEATTSFGATVTKGHRGHDHGHDEGEGHAHRAGAAPDAAPPTSPPTGRPLGRRAVEGPVPNLRSLPAWGIDVDESGNYLRFSATVWNAGDSPLVVDGFVDETRQDRMKAYQYFFDTDGNQTGYQPVGQFEFDHKQTHQHWHFTDFATYTLLRADKSTAVVSRKEAFCLANTDAVDLTVPGADWQPDNTDLSTDCGEPDSRSLRQVLAAGWGDTYAQFRAGQSFDLRGLPNGTYYIATIANPRQRLVESSTTDNVALRKVVIGGKPGARVVRAARVGIVDEPSPDNGDGY